MTLTTHAIAQTGLADVVDRRCQGTALGNEELARFEGLDLLVLGAIANEIRRHDCGDNVQVYLTKSPGPEAPFSLVTRQPGHDGTAFFRSVAMARLALTPGARLAVDFDVIGLALAQAALPFGISDLIGTLRSQKGLVMAGDTLSAHAKRREIAGCIARAERVAVFADENPTSSSKIAQVNDRRNQT